MRIKRHIHQFARHTHVRPICNGNGNGCSASGAWSQLKAGKGKWRAFGKVWRAERSSRKAGAMRSRRRNEPAGRPSVRLRRRHCRDGARWSQGELQRGLQGERAPCGVDCGALRGAAEDRRGQGADEARFRAEPGQVGCQELALCFVQAANGVVPPSWRAGSPSARCGGTRTGGSCSRSCTP